ncbi:uncharacterized protein METZ01_LOCUS239476 [marine metagenome]|uniref:Pyrroline-5-carboxylate reductase catalytic N-terminal domain-containing protein n=1 Tax=marine metagenome TaxID=408172 RepID=A0A382HHH4_9ZZZZ
MKLINEVVKKITAIGKKERKKTVFLIGNTIKVEDAKFYLTPIRNYAQVVLSGVIVYSEEIAKKIAKEVDGLVDYIFVDAEKKISDKHSITGEPGNIERAVKEVIKKSVFISYKSNDLTVDAADALISEYFSKDIRHVGGKKIAIIGVGNIGSKLAQKLVERGANVSLYRRNRDKLNLIVKQINTTKSKYTVAQASSALSVNEACKDADILIGATDGIPVIDASIINNLPIDSLLIDIGKGSISEEAIKKAYLRNLAVYRLSIESALEGMVVSLISTHDVLNQTTGRGFYHKIKVVSGGLLAQNDEIVVDDYRKPKLIYGIGNGYGDFMRIPGKKMEEKLDLLKKLLLKDNLD